MSSSSNNWHASWQQSGVDSHERLHVPAINKLGFHTCRQLVLVVKAVHTHTGTAMKVKQLEAAVVVNRL